MLLALRLGAIGSVRLSSFKGHVQPRTRMRVSPLRDERPIRLMTVNAIWSDGQHAGLCRWTLIREGGVTAHPIWDAKKAFVEIQAKLYKCGLFYRQGMRNTRMVVGAF